MADGSTRGSTMGSNRGDTTGSTERLVSITEAARLARRGRTTIEKAVASGRLRDLSLERDGRSLKAVSLAELAEEYPAARKALEGFSEPVGTRGHTSPTEARPPTSHHAHLDSEALGAALARVEALEEALQKKLEELTVALRFPRSLPARLEAPVDIRPSGGGDRGRWWRSAWARAIGWVGATGGAIGLALFVVDARLERSALAQEKALQDRGAYLEHELARIGRREDSIEQALSSLAEDRADAEARGAARQRILRRMSSRFAAVEWGTWPAFLELLTLTGADVLEERAKLGL